MTAMSPPALLVVAADAPAAGVVAAVVDGELDELSGIELLGRSLVADP